MDKKTHATINGEECQIGDFVVCGSDPSVRGAERIYRVAGVKFDADGCFINCVTDSRFSSAITVWADAVRGVLLESEVGIDVDGRFKRAD